MLPPEEELKISQALDTQKKEEAVLVVQVADTAKEITWLNTLDALNKEIVSLADEANKLQSDSDTFQPDHEKLSRAVSAASLDGAYATLTAMREQQSSDQGVMKALEKELPGMEASVENHAALLKSSEEQTVRAKGALATEEPVIKSVRSSDQTIATQSKTIQEREASCEKEAAKIKAEEQAQIKELKKRSDSEKAQVLVDNYLRGHSQDEWLISGLAGVEEQLKGLLAKQTEISQKEADQGKAVVALEQAVKSYTDFQKQSDTQKRKVDDASKGLQQDTETLRLLLGERVLREYRTEKEALLREVALLYKIAKLEEDRAKLEDGKPCPLCGSHDHPYAKGNVPVADAIEQKIETLDHLISQAEDMESAIKKLETAEASARKILTEKERQEAVAIGDKKAAEQSFLEVKNALENLQSNFEVMKKAVSSKLQPLGYAIDFADPQSTLDKLSTSAQVWQAKVREQAKIEKQIADFDSELKRLDAVIKTQGTALTEKQEQLEELKKDFSAGSAERARLYGVKNPDDEERRLKRAISQAENAEKQTRDQYNELQQKWNTAKTQVDSLKKSIEHREPRLKALETEFSSALVPVDFSDETQFLAARLSSAQREALATKAKELEGRQTDLKARQKDRETRLNTERAKKVTEKPLEELEPQFKNDEASLNELRDLIASLKNKLLDNTSAKDRIRDKQSAIEAQKTECRRWDNLHYLIGSGDGKNIVILHKA